MTGWGTRTPLAPAIPIFAQIPVSALVSHMLTGELRSQIDAVWNAFWSGGISNPLEVMEQITYLLFIRRLDDAHTLEESKLCSSRSRWPRTVFPEGNDPKGRDYNDLRWSRHHMKDARFTIPTPALLAKVVDLLDTVPMDDRDTKGDLYEYMLGKIASAGQNGQFRTPRHIIELMVALTAPTPQDTICDPASGTCGFLVAAGEYLRRTTPTCCACPRKTRTSTRHVPRLRL
jgi:type I restriction enzyme M protein